MLFPWAQPPAFDFIGAGAGFPTRGPGAVEALWLLVLAGEESRALGDRDSGSSPLPLSTDYRGSCMTSLEQRGDFHEAEARADAISSCCLETHCEVEVQKVAKVKPTLDGSV